MLKFLPIRCLKTLALTLLCLVSIAAPFSHAEIVPVLGRGQVDLTDYECSDMSSPIIKRVCFEKDHGYLLVKVDKKWYQYCAVGGEIFQSLIESKNAARYYTDKIKDALDCFH
jgi:hypothetical protein